MNNGYLELTLDMNSDDGKMRIYNMITLDYDGAMSNHNNMMAEVLVSRSVYEAEGIKKSAKGKSGYVDKSVKKTVEAALPSLTEPFLNKSIVSAQGRDAMSDEKAEVVSKLLNYQWNYGFAALPFVEQLNRDNMVDGTIFVKTGWNSDRDSAYSEIIDLDTLIVDPSATCLEDANFVVERKKVSIGEILRNPKLYGEHTLESLNGLDGAITTDFDRDEIGKDNNFNFEDKVRQMVEIKIYYGSVPVNANGDTMPILAIWSDEVMINVMPSPYPDEWNGIPFSSEVYSRVTGSMYGEGLPTILEDGQLIRTQLQRSIFDTLDASTNGQRGFKAGTLDANNKRKFKSGKDFEFNTATAEIWEGSYNPISSDVYNLMDRTQQDNEEMSGISRLNAGLDPRALNSNVTATASSLVNSAAERRLLLITRHTSALLESMFRKWLDMNKLMLTNGSVRVGNEIIDITNVDLEGNYDVTLNIATAGEDQARAQLLGGLIPQLAQNPAVPQSVIMQLTADMTESMKLFSTSDTLGNIAKQMKLQEESEQPTPEQIQQQQMQQAAMELEMREKQANITFDESRATLNNVKAQETHIDNQMKLYE